MTKPRKFVIVHDKKQKEIATILQTLAAGSIENSKWELLRYKKGEKLSKENMVFIGKEGANDYLENFSDVYCKYGIHIGFRNTRAWIYCEKFNWTAETLSDFKDEMTELYKIAEMNPHHITHMPTDGIPDDKEFEESLVEYVKRLIKTGRVEKNDRASFAQAAIWGSLLTISALMLLNPVAAGIGYGSAAVIGSGAGFGGAAMGLTPGKKFIYWITRTFSESKRIDCQYRFATVLFYTKYLDKYLGGEQNETSNGGE